MQKAEGVKIGFRTLLKTESGEVKVVGLIILNYTRVISERQCLF
jgi:hypothetical protein